MSQPYQPTSNQPVGATPPGAPYQQTGAEDPGKTLGIVGLILSFFTALIGLIVSAIALSKSKKAGFKNTPALVGVIIGAIGTVIAIILIISTIALAGAAANKCAELGPGTHQEGGVTYTCG
jgi:hypothetical protein